MARLRAATQRVVPVEDRREVAPAPEAEEKPRFGINSLINRMTGAAEGQTPTAPRQQPTIQRTSAAPMPQNAQADTEEEQERIEIPAFLRRQAN